MTKWQKYPTYAIFLKSWWFKDVKNDNPKCSDPRHSWDFCTVPPGLLSIVFNVFLNHTIIYSITSDIKRPMWMIRSWQKKWGKARQWMNSFCHVKFDTKRPIVNDTIMAKKWGKIEFAKKVWEKKQTSMIVRKAFQGKVGQWIDSFWKKAEPQCDWIVIELWNVIELLQDRQDMRSMFRVCATERLFVPDIFPDMDRAIYIDTDLIFMRLACYSFLDPWKSSNEKSWRPINVGWKIALLPIINNQDFCFSWFAS